MSEPTPTPTFILTNDDGIDAPGLAALIEATEGLGRRVVVAPSGPWSGCGHAVTTSSPIRFRRVGPDRWSVDGSPADCVRLALHRIEPDHGGAWVVSGINAGGNLGADVFHSGTVAAAREAAFRGRPAVAISHYIARGRPIDWAVASRRAAAVLDALIRRPRGPGLFWGVNLPHPEPGAPEPRLVDCPLDTSPLPLDFRDDGDGARYCGDYHARARVPGADVDVCFRGDIAVTRLGLSA